MFFYLAFSQDISFDTIENIQLAKGLVANSMAGLSGTNAIEVQGVKITDLKLGTGPEIQENSKAYMHYVGYLKDGKVFDKNEDGDVPFNFILGNGEVIQGWDIGVVGMKEGGKRNLFIPSDKAYGPQGSLPDIQPNSDLYFNITLVKFDVISTAINKDKALEQELKSKGVPLPDKIMSVVDGVTIKDETVGSGPEITDGKKATMHYIGTFMDGKEFDKNQKGDKPFTFTLGAGQVIKGWDIGVKGMKAGGRRILTIPYKLAYGEKGYPGAIPPKSDLKFDITLVSFQ